MKYHRFTLSLFSFVFFLEQVFIWAMPVSFGTSRVSYNNYNNQVPFAGGNIDLIGIKVSKNKLNFIFSRPFSKKSKEDMEYIKKYPLKCFFLALTLPDKDFWVNLSPDIFDSDILGDSLKNTYVGRLFLYYDVKLKEDVIRLLDGNEKFYNFISSISTGVGFAPRFWIEPGPASVAKTGNGILIDYAMLDVKADVLAQDSILSNKVKAWFEDNIIPALKDIVNNSQDYAPLRTAYYAIALAQWYKLNAKEGMPFTNLIDISRIGPDMYSEVIWFKGSFMERYLGLYYKSYISDMDMDIAIGGMNLEYAGGSLNNGKNNTQKIGELGAALGVEDGGEMADKIDSILNEVEEKNWDAILDVYFENREKNDEIKGLQEEFKQRIQEYANFLIANNKEDVPLDNNVGEIAESAGNDVIYRSCKVATNTGDEKKIPFAVLPDDGAKIMAVGDLHGDMEALKEIIGDFTNRLRNGENIRLVFLGDYIDRGRKSLSVLMSVLELHKEFPDRVVVLRGNHETADNLSRRSVGIVLPSIVSDDWQKGLDLINSLFANLPHMALRGKTVFVHGGVPVRQGNSGIIPFYDMNFREFFGSAKIPIKDGIENALYDNVIYGFMDILWNDPILEKEDLKSEGNINYVRGLRNANAFGPHSVGEGIVVCAHNMKGAGAWLGVNPRVFRVFSTGKGSDDSGYKNRPHIPSYAIVDFNKKDEENRPEIVNIPLFSKLAFQDESELTDKIKKAFFDGANPVWVSVKEEKGSLVLTEYNPRHLDIYDRVYLIVDKGRISYAIKGQIENGGEIGRKAVDLLKAEILAGNKKEDNRKEDKGEESRDNKQKDSKSPSQAAFADGMWPNVSNLDYTEFFSQSDGKTGFINFGGANSNGKPQEVEFEYTGPVEVVVKNKDGREVNMVLYSSNDLRKENALFAAKLHKNVGFILIGKNPDGTLDFSRFKGVWQAKEVEFSSQTPNRFDFSEFTEGLLSVVRDNNKIKIKSDFPYFSVKLPWTINKAEGGLGLEFAQDGLKEKVIEALKGNGNLFITAMLIDGKVVLSRMSFDETFFGQAFFLQIKDGGISCGFTTVDKDMFSYASRLISALRMLKNRPVVKSSKVSGAAENVKTRRGGKVASAFDLVFNEMEEKGQKSVRRWLILDFNKDGSLRDVKCLKKGEAENIMDLMGADSEFGILEFLMVDGKRKVEIVLGKDSEKIKEVVDDYNNIKKQGETRPKDKGRENDTELRDRIFGDIFNYYSGRIQFNRGKDNIFVVIREGNEFYVEKYNPAKDYNIYNEKVFIRVEEGKIEVPYSYDKTGKLTEVLQAWSDTEVEILNGFLGAFDSFLKDNLSAKKVYEDDGLMVFMNIHISNYVIERQEDIENKQNVYAWASIDKESGKLRVDMFSARPLRYEEGEDRALLLLDKIGNVSVIREGSLQEDELIKAKNYLIGSIMRESPDYRDIVLGRRNGNYSLIAGVDFVLDEGQNFNLVVDGRVYEISYERDSNGNLRMLAHRNGKSFVIPKDIINMSGKDLISWIRRVAGPSFYPGALGDKRKVIVRVEGNRIKIISVNHGRDNISVGIPKGIKYREIEYRYNYELVPNRNQKNMVNRGIVIAGQFDKTAIDLGTNKRKKEIMVVDWAVDNKLNEFYGEIVSDLMDKIRTSSKVNVNGNIGQLEQALLHNDRAEVERIVELLPGEIKGRLINMLYEALINRVRYGNPSFENGNMFYVGDSIDDTGKCRHVAYIAGAIIDRFSNNGLLRGKAYWVGDFNEEHAILVYITSGGRQLIVDVVNRAIGEMNNLSYGKLSERGKRELKNMYENMLKWFNEQFVSSKLSNNLWPGRNPYDTAIFFGGNSNGQMGNKQIVLDAVLTDNREGVNIRLLTNNGEESEITGQSYDVEKVKSYLQELAAKNSRLARLLLDNWRLVKEKIDFYILDDTGRSDIGDFFGYGKDGLVVLSNGLLDSLNDEARGLAFAHEILESLSDSKDAQVSINESAILIKIGDSELVFDLTKQERESILFDKILLKGRDPVHYFIYAAENKDVGEISAKLTEQIRKIKENRGVAGDRDILGPGSVGRISVKQRIELPRTVKGVVAEWVSQGRADGAIRDIILAAYQSDENRIESSNAINPIGLKEELMGIISEEFADRQESAKQDWQAVEKEKDTLIQRLKLVSFMKKYHIDVLNRDLYNEVLQDVASEFKKVENDKDSIEEFFTRISYFEPLRASASSDKGGIIFSMKSLLF